DLNGNLVRAANEHSITSFDYNPNGQLIGQHHWKVPTREENARNGLINTDWRDPQYDMLFQPITKSVHYHYDFNGNRTTTVLPDGRQINYLYYGSGHLHQINLDGEVVSDIERDKLHREIQRTQGKLTSNYELDPVGRLKKQIAALNGLSESGKGKSKVAAGYGHTAVKRSYGYDKTGNLLHSTDQRTGTTHFEYDKLGQPLKVQNQTFAFDPAYNLINEYGEQVKDNRIAAYNGIKFFYDDFGNTIHKEHSDGSTQNLHYDLFDRLVKVETFKKNAETGEWDKEVWAFEYDALDRRVSKGRLKNGTMETVENVSDGLRDNACLKAENSKDIIDSEITFLWDGSHLLQEQNSDGLYTYIYTDQDSYEPLAQIRDWTDEEGKSQQQTNYFHCDQIGIPREMTDKDGNLLWFGDYYGWGKLKSETNITETAHQPFRLQNQYCDRETGLHYNFFRYYDSDVGRFVNQDPIGLLGGFNFYHFGYNTLNWVDFLGLRGVYYFTDMTQSYIGKGPFSRMKRSIRYRTKKRHNQPNPMSPPTACVHVKLKSDKMALMVEARLMAIHDAKMNTSFMNKILSNGVKLYADKNTTDLERNIADRYARAINQRMENIKSGKCKSSC
ncbi:RHS repeat-associated core domain-containing protein, partial [Neisseria animaloris]|uniref:RHS repeat-associated core domain-containing protein n=1 Tax=Neisseria animaloris TaxID=326522 RepID=UPI0018FF3312